MLNYTIKFTEKIVFLWHIYVDKGSNSVLLLHEIQNFG